MKLNINLQVTADIKEEYKDRYTKDKQGMFAEKIIYLVRNRIPNWLGVAFENDLITMDIKFTEETL